MALTYATPNAKVSNGARWLVVQPVTLDNSYPTGGYALDQTLNGQLPDGIIDAVIPAGISQSAVTSTVIVQYNAQTGKLQAFWSAASGAQPLEVTAATNLSSFTFLLVVVGR